MSRGVGGGKGKRICRSGVNYRNGLLYFEGNFLEVRLWTCESLFYLTFDGVLNTVAK